MSVSPSSAVIPGDRFFETGHWESVWTVRRIDRGGESDIPYVLMARDERTSEYRRIPLYTLLVPRNFRRVNTPRPRLAA